MNYTSFLVKISLIHRKEHNLEIVDVLIDACLYEKKKKKKNCISLLILGCKHILLNKGLCCLKNKIILLGVIE